MFEFGSPTKKYHCTLCHVLSSKIDSDANVIVLHYFSLACHLCHFHSSYMFMSMCVCRGYENVCWNSAFVASQICDWMVCCGVWS